MLCYSELGSLAGRCAFSTTFFSRTQNCHSVFGLRELVQNEKLENITVSPITRDHLEDAVHILKEHYLPEHVLVRSRSADLSNDRALDQYLAGVLKQGNSLCARSDDGTVAGVCVNFVSGPLDPGILRNFAFYRQDPNVKDFLNFTAKLQETPNLWNIFKQPNVFEIKMLAVVPDFRRQNIAVSMVERSLKLAEKLEHNVVRMDCINPHDYKIAERCMMRCLAKFPLHKLRGPSAAFVKRSSRHNSLARVYVAVTVHTDIIVDKVFRTDCLD